LEGVLFAYNSGRSCYGCVASGNSRILSQLGKLALESGVRRLAGNSAYVQPAIRGLHSRALLDVRHSSFYQVSPEQLARHHDYPVRVAGEDDIHLLTELYRGYEFRNPNRSEREVEDEVRRVMDESGRYFLVELEGRAVSAASVAPETDRAGMISSARTLPGFRGQGIYLSVRTACFEYLFEQGKIGLGFFQDTNASMINVLNKQGGTVTATWSIVHLRKKPPLRRRILPSRLRRWGSHMKGMIMGRKG
jgi:predicted GNAT family acetyltransferase